MKQVYIFFYTFFLLLIAGVSNVLAQNRQDLRIVFIRHAEKPAKGDQLSCGGYNRSVQLADVLVRKFGVPDAVYVPSITNKKAAKALRMMETALPLAIKYNLSINSKFDVDEKAELAQNLLKRSGIVLVVWEHNALPGIIKKLGIVDQLLEWPADDYDSIWIVTLLKGKTALSKDKENIYPLANCPF